MSKVILYIATSVDGYIADKDGGVSWLDDFGDCDCGYEKFMNSIGSLIMGAKTYEQILTFDVGWPYKGKKSYILTHRSLQAHPDGDIEFIDDDVEAIVKKAKDAAGEKDVWLVGGTNLVTSFLNSQAIDEMMIFVVPTLLNKGISLFNEISSKQSLKLKESTSYDNGIVLLHYLASLSHK